MQTITPFMHLCHMGAALGIDLVRFVGASLQSRAALAAENLFLRKQLALYRERPVRPRRASIRSARAGSAGAVLRLA